MNKTCIAIGYALPHVPNDLEETDFPTYLVNECFEFGIKTTSELLLEFSKPKSWLLNRLESIDIAKLIDAFIEWDILPTTSGILCQMYPPSLN